LPFLDQTQMMASNINLSVIIMRFTNHRPGLVGKSKRGNLWEGVSDLIISVLVVICCRTKTWRKCSFCRTLS
jgi:hypothetical protein